MLRIADWADIFCGHSWVAGGCYGLKKMLSFFSKCFKFFFPRATGGLSNSFNNNFVGHKKLI